MNPEKEIARNRLRQLILWRPLLTTLLLVSFLFLHFNSIKGTSYETLFYLLIGATWLLTAVYFFSLRWMKNLALFAATQLVFDLLLETVLTGITGGVESPFSILYIVTIVLGALFFYQKGGVWTATAALLLLGTAPLLPPFSLSNTPSLFQNEGALYRLLLHAIAFYSVGILSGRFFRKTVEKEVGLSKLRLLHDDIVKSIPSGVITTDLDGTITSFNHAAAEITGIETEEALGVRWWTLFSWDEIQTQYRNMARTGAPHRFEGEIQKKGGGRCYLRATISPLRNDRGETTGVIGIFEDLTHLKSLEAEMNQKRWLAMIGEMAAGMAHEIRNPLASLSGSVQLLKNEPSLDHENRRLMEIALHETDRLNAIMTEFVLYAKPHPPRRRWVSIPELLSETVALIKKSPEAAGPVRIKLETDLPLFPATPTTDTPPSTLLFIDPDQIKQVFWNLSINAFHAMPEGGTLTIITRNIASQDSPGQGGRMEIHFCDTGTGIQKDDLSRIFYPFFTTKSSGSGLGLSIVQRIIDQHSGTISVDSSSAGTRFVISLPRGIAPDETP